MPRVPIINRVPDPSVNRIPKPIVDRNPSPPVVTSLDPPIVEVPGYDPPSYELPQLTPDAELSSPSFPTMPGKPPEMPQEETRDIPPPRPQIALPGGNDVPLPTGGEVALAGTTAIAATAAALLGKGLVDFLVKLLKPVIKKAVLKAKEAVGVRFTHLEEQQYFELQGQVAKQLKADAKAEKLRQLEEHSQQQRQRRR